MGPYATEREAAAESMPRAVTALHVQAGDPDRAAYTLRLRALYDVCDGAGVQLGSYDMRTLEWLARWEPTTVQAIVGIIARAGRGGCNEPGS